MSAPRGPESRYHGVARVSRQGRRDQPESPAREQDSLLAAMISTVAEGQPAGDLEKAILRLKLIRQAQERNLSWAAIARALGYPSGRQLKADTHRLAEHVTRELRLAQNQDAKVTP